MLYTNEKVIKNKVGLLNLAEELQNISKACKVMGFSRETFYRYKKAVEEGGVESLIEKTRRKPNLHNRVDAPCVRVVVASTENPSGAKGETTDDANVHSVQRSDNYQSTVSR